MWKANWLGIVTLALAFCASARGDDASQVLKLSKSGTALIVLPEDRGSGSGFCIDPTGVFITNAHVVKSVGKTESVTVVTNPGETGEKVFRAKVVASDPDRDLAILQTTDGKDFTPLSLGSDKDLIETQQLTALGFPFGSELSVADHKYPSISVNLVHISALRRSNDMLERIQIDSQLNPGNSGGPVVDSSGRVVGVVSSGILGGGINFAIPVSTLASFLNTPKIAFTPPNLTAEQLSSPYDLTVGVVSLDKDNRPMSVQFILGPGTSSEQQLDATPAGPGQFKVHVVPNTAKDAGKLRVGISLPDGLVQSTIDDTTVKLDDREFKLSQLSHLERSFDKATVTLRDGSEVTGKSLTINDIKTNIAGQTVPIDGSKIEKIIVYSSNDQAAKPAYKIVVKRDGKVVAQETGMFGQSGAAQDANASTRPDDAIQAQLDDAKDLQQKTAQLAKQHLLDVIEARTQAAADRGDLDAVKSLDAAKTSVEADGKLPEDMKDAVIVGAMNTYLSEVKQSNARLAIAYQQAIRDYTRARKTDEAQAIKNEMAEKGIANNGDSAGAGLAGFSRLGGTNRLPLFLEPNPNAFSEGQGLQLNGDDMIRTRDGTWLNQDFTFDLLYSYKPGVQGIGVVGFGEGPGQQNVLFLRLHTPNLINGFVGMGGTGVQEAELTKVSSNGPHMLRIEKKGESITVSLCIDYKGTFTADATRTMNDIKTAAPYLNAKNTYLFFGRGGLIFQEVRLSHSTSN